MTTSNPIELDTPENYPAIDAALYDDCSINKTALYRQLGCKLTICCGETAAVKFPVYLLQKKQISSPPFTP